MVILKIYITILELMQMGKKPKKKRKTNKDIFKENGVNKKEQISVEDLKVINHNKKIVAYLKYWLGTQKPRKSFR